MVNMCTHTHTRTRARTHTHTANVSQILDILDEIPIAINEDTSNMLEDLTGIIVGAVIGSTLGVTMVIIIIVVALGVYLCNSHTGKRDTRYKLTYTYGQYFT